MSANVNSSKITSSMLGSGLFHTGLLLTVLLMKVDLPQIKNEVIEIKIEEAAEPLPVILPPVVDVAESTPTPEEHQVEKVIAQAPKPKAVAQAKVSHQLTPAAKLSPAAQAQAEPDFSGSDLEEQLSAIHMTAPAQSADLSDEDLANDFAQVNNETAQALAAQTKQAHQAVDDLIQESDVEAQKAQQHENLRSAEMKKQSDLQKLENQKQLAALAAQKAAADAAKKKSALEQAQKEASAKGAAMAAARKAEQEQALAKANAAMAAAMLAEKEAAEQVAAERAAAQKGAIGSGGQGVVRSLEDLRQMPGNGKPSYDSADRFAKRQGVVVFHAFIAGNGQPREFKLVKSSGHKNLDLKTYKAIRDWKFYPGQEGWVEIPFQWDLKGEPKVIGGTLRKISQR